MTRAELRSRILDAMQAGRTVSEMADAALAAIEAAGLAVVPQQPTEDMFMRGGNVSVSNRGKDHLNPRPGKRIGDMAARDAYLVMLRTFAEDTTRAEKDRLAAAKAKEARDA